MQPFISPASPLLPGVMFGFNKRTKEAWVYDPWFAKATGEIPSTTALFTGTLGSGKTAAAKVALLRYLTRRVTDGRTGELINARGRVHDRKTNEGKPEYTRIRDALGGIEVALNRKAGINIFDPLMHMKETDILEAALSICELVRGRAVPGYGYQTLALQVAVSKMVREFGNISSPEVLIVLLNSLERRDVEEYFNRLNETVRRTFHEKLEADQELAQRLADNMDRPRNVNEDMVKADAGLLVATLSEVLDDGPYGGIFGGHQSLRELLTARFVQLNWNGVPPKARTLAEHTLLWWQEAARTNNDLDLIPHINIGDEEASAFDDLEHVKSKGNAIMKARSFFTWDITITQFESQLAQSGDEGSELHKRSENISLGFGARFYFGQPKSKQFEEHLISQGIEKYDRELIYRQGVGEFAYKPQNIDAPPTFVKLILTKDEARLAASDYAVESMTELGDVMLPEELEPLRRELVTLN
jgi:hypothetical protein